MDDLLDLDWSGNSSSSSPSKTAPPSIPHKPSYLAGNPTTKKKDAFADLLSLSSSQPKQPDRSKLSLAELQQQQHNTAAASWLKPVQPFSSSSSSTKAVPLQQQPLASNSISTPSLSARPLAPARTQSASASPEPQSSPSMSFEALLDPFGGQKKKENNQLPLDALKRSQATKSPAEYFQSQHEGQWNFDLLENSRSSVNTVAQTDDDPFNLNNLQKNDATPIGADDDNPLGILAGPAVKKPRSPSPPLDTETAPPSSDKSTSPKSQHAHLLAQLIEMGFGPEESRVALEATGGHDLKDVVDLLVSNAEAVQQQGQRRAEKVQRQQQTPYGQSMDRESETARARRALFGDQTKQDQTRQSSRNGSGRVLDGLNAAVLQQHKEKLVAQASELGGLLYKNASMLVKTGRQRITKAVEEWQEQQRAEQMHRQHRRPRWMTHAVDNEEIGEDEKQMQFSEKFVDDNSSDEDPEVERQRELEWKQQQEARRREYIAQMKKKQQQHQELKQARLKQQEQEEEYVSPSRRRVGGASASRVHDKAAAASAPAPVSPAPKAVRTRPIVQASPETLAKANQFRQRGNEQFKLGQFGEAENAYSAAISILPSGHDHLVVLRNNRAAARLKIGDHKGCIEDCVLVIEMAKASGDGPIESEGGVKIVWREQISKALKRKAEALESMEKYADAIQAYEELLRFDGAINGNIINQALARCRRAMQPVKLSPPSAKSAFTDTDYPIFETRPSSSGVTRTTTTTVSTAHIEQSKAVAAMRAQAAQQEAEEAERVAKNDVVNARITAWKAGKEQNLRALLATLDTLLWPGVQWRGAQMSELIDPKRCKVIYMKAIAKVHPDKLPPSTTIEQRMLASAIFSTLNEAWDTFKSQELQQ